MITGIRYGQMLQCNTRYLPEIRAVRRYQRRPINP
jgi:hypothetical protein